MKLGMVLGCCLMLAWAVGPAGATNARSSAEASMLVTGTLEINADGTVRGYAIDQPDKLPAPVRDVIQKNVPGWTFKLDPAAAAMATRITRSPSPAHRSATTRPRVTKR
jgi:hypothetical protein